MQNIFGDRMRYHRLQKGMTQMDLANQLHVAQPTVAYWEHGKKTPELAKAVRLADILGVSLDYLNGRTDDPTARLAPRRPNPDGEFVREYV